MPVLLGYNRTMLWPAAALLLAQAAVPELAAAAKALEAEKFAEAAPLLEKAVAADSQDFRARFNLAFAYTQLGRDREAVEQYQKVVDQQPDLLPARMNLGMLLLRRKDPLAAPHLEFAAEKKPDDFRSQYYFAEALAGSGQPDRAAEHYRKALVIDPKSAAATLGLGRTLAGAGRLDDAREQFLRAAALHPRYGDSLLELGDLLEQKQQPAQAAELYLEYLKSRPDSIAVRERAGVLLMHQKRYPEAIEHLEAAVNQNPTAANQAALAQAYTMTKQPAKALPLLRAAAAAEPASPELRFRLATAQLEASDFAGAAREFLFVVEKQPDRREAWSGLGLAWYRQENFDGALKALHQAGRLGPEPAGNHYLRAIILDKFKQYPGALASYQKFLEAAAGRYPDDEFKARQRVRILTNILNKRR